ncbi:MAG: hypothetical protein ABJB61_13265 [bacterium]
MAENVSTLASFAAPPPVAPRLVKALYRENEIIPDWLRVLKWSLAIMAVFTAYHVIEKFIVHAPHPFIYNPAEFSCRVVGLSHYSVGLLFLLTAHRMRRASSLAWFVSLLVLGVMLCVFFYKFGADKNPVLQMLFFLYFIIHGYRDMVFFYRPLSATPGDIERLRHRILNLTQACLLLSLYFILVPLYLVYLNNRHKFYEPELKARIDLLMPYLKLTLLFGWPILLICFVKIWRAIRTFPGGQVWTDNRPIFLVLISASIIFLASPILGVWTFHLLILTHFVGWYLFASRRMSTLPTQSTWSDGLWKWIRGSVAGFQTLHVGVAVVFLALILISFLFPSLTLLTVMVNSKAFYYWNLIHVTISFAPK